MRTVVFDLDGTLADTSGDLIAAANSCFPEPVLDSMKDKAVSFQGGRAMLRLGLKRSGCSDEAQVESMFPKLLDYYGDNIDTHTHIYPGVMECLENLHSSGWKLAVCTNKPEALAETLLTRLKMRTYFSAMLGADTLPVRKPDPRHILETVARAGGNPKRAVMIGDTDNDSKAAHSANIPCILVTFGPLGRAVAALNPQGLLDHYDHLPEMLDNLVR